MIEYDNDRSFVIHQSKFRLSNGIINIHIKYDWFISSLEFPLSALQSSELFTLSLPLAVISNNKLGLIT